MVGLDSRPADLIAELNDARLEVRYREGQREVRALEELPAPTSGSDIPFKRNGVYLVSGGAGGLGTIFAEHLVQMYNARLLLIGRSELSEPKRQEVQRFGGHVHYLRADVSRLEEATQAVRDAKDRFGGLNGVIHAAGELQKFPLRNAEVFEQHPRRMGQAGGLLPTQFQRKVSYDFIELDVRPASLKQINNLFAQRLIFVLIVHMPACLFFHIP
jgi:hypothetical protein